MTTVSVNTQHGQEFLLPQVYLPMTLSLSLSLSLCVCVCVCVCAFAPHKLPTNTHSHGNKLRSNTHTCMYFGSIQAHTLAPSK